VVTRTCEAARVPFAVSPLHFLADRDGKEPTHPEGSTITRAHESPMSQNLHVVSILLDGVHPARQFRR